MTYENELYRSLLKDVEADCASSLASQPQGDRACEIHLLRALLRVAGRVNWFAGKVAVEVYDIAWETDGENVELPESAVMAVDPDGDISEQITSELSDGEGWLVSSMKWRML